MTIPYQQPKPHTGTNSHRHTRTQTLRHTDTHTHSLISIYNIDMNQAYIDDKFYTASMSNT